MLVHIIAAAVCLSLVATSALALPPVAIPELDPGAVTTALTLLAGGLIVLRGRRCH